MNIHCQIDETKNDHTTALQMKEMKLFFADLNCFHGTRIKVIYGSDVNTSMPKTF